MLRTMGNARHDQPSLATKSCHRSPIRSLARGPGSGLTRRWLVIGFARSRAAPARRRKLVQAVTPGGPPPSCAGAQPAVGWGEVASFGVQALPSEVSPARSCPVGDRVGQVVREGGGRAYTFAGFPERETWRPDRVSGVRRACAASSDTPGTFLSHTGGGTAFTRGRENTWSSPDEPRNVCLYTAEPR